MADQTSNNDKINPKSNIDPTSDKLSDQVNDIFKKTPIGSVDSAISDSIYGINHRQTPGAIQINKDYYGLTFFTRPELNLTTDNLRVVRKLAPLLTNNPNSIQRAIRCLLDRRLAQLEGIDTPLIDQQQAFIPLLTNHLLSMSGWPDIIAPTMTSIEGIYKESFSMVDGITDIYSTYDITANFRNIPGDPITMLFYSWIYYASYVFQGVLVPYPDKIIENEIDYQTRIYRLVLDSTKRYVRKIAACGAAFPTSAPLGASFNFEHDRPINNSNDQISIPFRCIGAMYQDDILIAEFNRTTALFNGSLDDSKFRKTSSRNKYTNEIYVHETHPSYVQIPIDLLGLFNNRGYPRINPDTYELGWWVTNEDYQSKITV